jgi:MFS transporter, DHA1 family, quinolone resistance protein
VQYGFYLATGFALLMAIGLWWNHFTQPAAARLASVVH